MGNSIADIRREYKLHSLNESDVAADPIEQFGKWWNEAVESDIEEVNAMTLATADREGNPSARIVLLKGFDKTGFSFFSNYQSRKGKELDENPKACLVFFWKELERQIRVTGLVSRMESSSSDAYFLSRPFESKVGAWSSPQSQVIADRDFLEKKFLDYSGQFANGVIVRPPHWGGYVLAPTSIEFWQGRPGRLHDRIQYTLEKNGEFKIERLAP